MSHEMPSDYELDMIEHQADAEAARINASLGDVDAKGQFDFCDGCPLLNGHTPEEAAEAQEYVGWSLGGGAGFNGAIINMRLKFEDGTMSKPMVQGAFEGSMFTGRMIGAARAHAVKQTQECEKPRKIPPFLGPIAVISCRALQKYKDPTANW